MYLIRRLVLIFASRRSALLALTFALVSSQLTVTALAAAPSSAIGLTHSVRAISQTAALCSPSPDSATAGSRCSVPAPADDAHVSVPDGSKQCAASGPGAACASDGASPQPSPGVASTPDGQSPCPAVSDGGLSSPAACTDTLLPAPASVIATGGDATLAPPEVTPSVPVSSLQAAQPPAQRLSLDASAGSVASGQKAILTATASASVTGTDAAIEIFDRTNGTLIGACSQSSQCIVAYAATSGMHTFAAYVAHPGPQLPAGGPSLTSNTVTVTWLGVVLAANRTLVSPGQAVTFTATTTFDVHKIGRSILLYDNSTKHILTYCSRGTSCSTSLTQASGGVHEIVGWIPGQPEATSDGITATWLAVRLDANTTYPQLGGTVNLLATANADLTNTPWSLGITDQEGMLVGQPCKSGDTCSASITLTSGAMPYFTAVVGSVPTVQRSSNLNQILTKVIGPTSLVNVQAHSAAVQATRLLWGVDSCHAFTTSPTGADGLFPQVVSKLGMPDFWGRYLTNTVCPAISSAEIATAAHFHMGILPIYNDYNCSNVVGYDTGKGYGAAATDAAAGLGIPQGRAIAIDIEPPGDACPGAAGVDAGFIQGWYDGVSSAGYVPAYYGNGTGGSEFGSAWCTAVAAQPAVGTYSYLWSFEPSLLGSFSKAAAPGYAPNQTGCAGPMAAWQYQISAGGSPDVDHDEALSTFPLWLP
ncbi:MAG: glycoside hydrolase domain-containing protein [Candidatus Dormibacteraceae bacterium]